MSIHLLVAAHSSEIANACRQFCVERLELFGSATGAGFDPETSDIDLLVSFTQEGKKRAFDNYFGLKDCLKGLLGRPVDLLAADSLSNPYLIREIATSRTTLYGA